MSPLRLLFFGTPAFAVPTLHALATGPHPVVGVLSQPDRPRGRGRVLEATPVRAEAERHALDVLQPEKVGEEAALEWMRAHRPDLGVVVAFGQFIPRKVRELPTHRLINGHASLLPRHRGAAPIPYAILSGDEKTGITVMRVEKEMDGGAACIRRELEIEPEETAGELSDRLAVLCAEALVDAVDRIGAGTAEFVEQDHARHTLAPKLDRAFATLDWSEPRGALLRRIRAATPWPGADVVLEPSGKRFRIVRARDGGPGAVTAGHVSNEAGRLCIAAADGWIEIAELRAPGKRATRGADFRRGARLRADERVSR